MVKILKTFIFLFLDCNIVMALNSADSDFGPIVETLNMRNDNFKCNNLKNYPMEVTSTFGANLPERNTPIVCGGVSRVNHNDITNKCFSLDESGWTETYSMIDRRMHFFGMSRSPYRNASHKMFILGYTRRAEVLTDNGWEYIGLPTPKLFHTSCVIIIDDSSIMVAGIYNTDDFYTGYLKMCTLLQFMVSVLCIEYFW